MNKNMFYHSSSKLIRNDCSALLFAILFAKKPYCYSTVPCISQTCPLSLWYCNSGSLLIWTYNQSKSIEQCVLLINGKHNVQGHTMCPLYSIQPTMHCTTVSILRLSPSHLQQPVCSLNWLILVLSHHLKQVKSVLSVCVQWHMFPICIWLLPLVFTSMDDMCIRVQNVFWEWECV